MKYIITTDNQEQGWLDSFNNSVGKDFKMNQEIAEENVDAVSIMIDDFNHYVARGPAIRLEMAE